MTDALDLDAVEDLIAGWEALTAGQPHVFTFQGKHLLVTDPTHVRFTLDLIAAEHYALPTFLPAARLVLRQARECTYCRSKGLVMRCGLVEPCPRCAPARAALAAIVGEQP